MVSPIIERGMALAKVQSGEVETQRDAEIYHPVLTPDSVDNRVAARGAA
jgi:hypothetical protein